MASTPGHQALRVGAEPDPDLPLVSIVTPVMNRRDTLPHCLRSVAEQTYPHIEHIVVDGGSTDGTIELLEQHDDIIWTSGSDTGMYNAINKGLATTTGSIIAYLNSDDVYLPYSIEVAVDALKGSSELIYGDLGVLTRGKDPVGFYPQFYRDFDLNYYTHVATLAQPTVFWKRSLMERIGRFDESYKLLGDCEYWLRAAVKGARPKHVEEILAVQIEHEGTLRVTRPDELQDEFKRLRLSYTPAAGPARSGRGQRLAKSLSWRYRQSLFVLAARSRSRRWPRFHDFMRQNRVRSRPSGLVWYALPGSVRPANASIIDGPELDRVLTGTGE
jgi:glycosyltransferase involved in cell wall biosynthesis